MQRFLAGDYPSGLVGYSKVTHEAGLTLRHPLTTARITNTVAGRLPLSAPRPAHPEILISQGRVAKRPPRPPKDVRSSGTGPGLLLRAALLAQVDGVRATTAGGCGAGAAEEKKADGSPVSVSYRTADLLLGMLGWIW